MSPDDIRALIVARLQQSDQCNSYFLNHLEGQIRALIAILLGGEPPPSGRGDLRVYLEAAQIPFSIVGEQIDFPDDWLRARGFSIRGNTIHHPVYSRSW